MPDASQFTQIKRLQTSAAADQGAGPNKFRAPRFYNGWNPGQLIKYGKNALLSNKFIPRYVYDYFINSIILSASYTLVGPGIESDSRYVFSGLRHQYSTTSAPIQSGSSPTFTVTFSNIPVSVFELPGGTPVLLSSNADNPTTVTGTIATNNGTGTITVTTGSSWTPTLPGSGTTLYFINKHQTILRHDMINNTATEINLHTTPGEQYITSSYMYIDRDNLYIGTSDNRGAGFLTRRIYTINKNTFNSSSVLVNFTNTDGAGQLRNIAVSSDGTIYTVTTTGMIFRGTDQNSSPLNSHPLAGFINGICIHKNHSDEVLYLCDPAARYVYMIKLTDIPLVINSGTATQYMKIFAGNGSIDVSGEYVPPLQGGVGSARGIAFDNEMNAYISSQNNHVIRKVDASGESISTFAGIGIDSTSGNGGLAINAAISSPSGIIFTSSDDKLYIKTSGGNIIRVINRVTRQLT